MRDYSVIKHMDEKCCKYLECFKALFENNCFDEISLIAFLIIIRSAYEDFVQQTCPNIKEVADLTAHRPRNRGIVMRAISVAINNCYKTINNSNIVEGYHGILYEEWKKEWICLGNKTNIHFSAETIHDITVCVMSVFQFSEYDDHNGHKGKIFLAQGRDNSLELYTTANQQDSLWVCFMKCPECCFLREPSQDSILKKPVMTKREGKILQLLDEDGRLL